MNNTVKKILGFGAVAVLAAGSAGAAVWWYLPKPAVVAGQAAPEPAPGPRKPARYVTLEKVIVMLQRSPGDTQAHYISADLVLATTAEDEKTTREHLPMLRSVAVRTLSGFPMSTASGMTVEQYATQINTSFKAHYAKEKSDKPFTDVMIGKLIIE
jgi:flagellar FliL protein